jgi:hypothetical protein
LLKYILLSFVLLNSVAHASVDWSLKNQFNLDSSPIEMISSVDAKTIFILVPGKILVYSLYENRIVDFMPVDRKFDHLSVSGKDKLFLLSSSKDNSVSVFERKKSLDYSGLPFKGPLNAPVTVAVFSDYQ